MWLDVSQTSGPPLNEPTMIVSLSTGLAQYRTLYSQARETAEYMREKMKFERVATIRASGFVPEVLVREDGTVSLPECGIYSSKGKKDILLLAGDASPSEDQYEFAQTVLELAEGYGVKELFSVGARWAENPLSPDQSPEPKGFSTDAAGVENLKAHGVGIISDEPAPFFSSMVVAVAPEYGIRGYKVSVDHGEPWPHPRSVTSILEALSSLVGFEISVEPLKEEARRTVSSREPRDRGIYH